MEKRIKNIMAAIFEIESSKIDHNTFSDTLDAWDSLKHMDLIVALEEEFHIEFSSDEIVELTSYDLIVETIKSKIVI
jgi:acyl carrier protein